MNKAFLSFALPVVVGLCLTACSEKQETPQPASPQKTDSGGSVLSAPTDYLSAAAKAKKSAEKTVDVSAINSALDQFYAGEGRYPKDLNELVTKKYLSQVPPAPVGMRIDYDANAGKVQIVAK
jgi:hypothetical protein